MILSSLNAPFFLEFCYPIFRNNKYRFCVFIKANAAHQSRNNITLEILRREFAKTKNKKFKNVITEMQNNWKIHCMKGICFGLAKEKDLTNALVEETMWFCKVSVSSSNRVFVWAYNNQNFNQNFKQTLKDIAFMLSAVLMVLHATVDVY